MIMINSGREWDWMDNKTKKMKKYIVIERNRKWDSFDFINDDTRDLGDIWHTHCPYKLSDDKKDGLKPMLFENRQDAVNIKTHNSLWLTEIGWKTVIFIKCMETLNQNGK